MLSGGGEENANFFFLRQDKGIVWLCTLEREDDKKSNGMMQTGRSE